MTHDEASSFLKSVRKLPIIKASWLTWLQGDETWAIDIEMCGSFFQFDEPCSRPCLWIVAGLLCLKSLVMK